MAEPRVAKPSAQGGAVSLTDADKPALDADSQFQEAVKDGQKTALVGLLDADFTWTNAAGKTLSRAQVLQEIPKPSIEYPDPDLQGPPARARTPFLGALAIYHNYGDLEAVQVYKQKDNILRIWVKRPAGWRLLVYQETRLMDTAPAATVGTNKTCENPCKTVPYSPKNANEKAVLASYMALQTATVLHDSATWGKYVADEFRAANSNSNQVLDKPGRMVDLERSKMAGYSPMPVVSLRIFDFGNAAVLVSRHQPEHGKPVHITRLWIKRNAQWQEAASYQTRIEAAAALP
ncbi:MAG TPA: nuclear transport factor 2 family protein [Candidatus Acidoferrales bacterium]